MRDSETEPGLNLNLTVPIALLVVLLIVPFSINALLHLLSSNHKLSCDYEHPGGQYRGHHSIQRQAI